MALNFAIRDDDTNYSTDAREIERIYSGVWEKAPVSLSVIPYIDAGVMASIKLKGCDFHEKQKQTGKEFPVGENRDLVYFLQEKIKEGKIYIMLHGYTHNDNIKKHTDELNYTEKIKRGKEYLEDLFNCEITVFVPPHNSILSPSKIKAIAENKLDLLVSYYHFPKSFIFYKISHIKAGCKLLLFYLKNGPGKLYPQAIHLHGHSQAYAYTLSSGFTHERISAGLEFAKKYTNANFCVATHYHDMTEENTAFLRTLVAKSEEDPGVNFVTCRGLFPQRQG